MISFYIHIPFCDKKCTYCSFFVAPTKDQIFISNYLKALLDEIDFWAENLIDKQVKTIYFGGGTPLCIGKENIFKIIDVISQRFDLEFLEELSIELNPNPFAENLDFITALNEKYKKFFRIRYSIGIQSFDDDILSKAGRNYYFNTLVGFLRSLPNHKKPNNVFNFDFIAFGDKAEFRDHHRINFFENFVKSGFADSFSIYTLELFPGSLWHQSRQTDEQAKELIYNEFSVLKDIVLENGFKRYEISNFSVPGKQSIHNQVYWDMGDYIGIGINSSSFVSRPILKNFDSSCPFRFKNTTSWKDYTNGNYVDLNTISHLTKKDLLFERFFLALRTSSGIKSIETFSEILVKDYKNKLQEFINQGFMGCSGDKIFLTDKGMDVYNYIVTQLVE